MKVVVPLLEAEMVVVRSPGARFLMLGFMMSSSALGWCLPSLL